MQDQFRFISGTEENVHGLYHKTRDSWRRVGARIFVEKGIDVNENQAVCESMISACIRSVIMHKGEPLDAKMLAGYVFTACTELLNEDQQDDPH